MFAINKCTYLGSEKDFQDQSLPESEGKYCCCQESLDSCCSANAEMDGCSAVGKNLETWHCVAYVAQWAPSCETEQGDCAAGCTHCVSEQGLEEGLNRGGGGNKIKNLDGYD